MGYTAVHPVWGRLDVSLDDLGCEHTWGEIHRVKGLRLACPECGGRVFARASRYGLRHFYHQVRPPDCELANESPEHHFLKLELAMAARAAGWRAELEVSSEAGDWRADVLVFDDRDLPFMALEAQLSPMTPTEARVRTDRYARDGVAVCWVALQDRPWARTVPTLRASAPAEGGKSWTVRHGLARYTWTPRTLKAKAAWEHITCPLGDALAWILQGTVRVHTAVNGTVWWTAPAYEERALERARMEAEAEAPRQEAAAERRREQAAAADRRRRAAEQRALDRQAELEERHNEMQRLSGFFRRTGFDLTAWDAFTRLVRTASGKAIVYGEQSPRYGNGLLVHARHRDTDGGYTLAAVVCPDPHALTHWPEKLDILVPDHTWLARIRAAARVPLRVAVLDPRTGRRTFERIPPAPVHRPGPDRPR
ncbi:competence protein CoiA [Streptomyces sp. ZL-24]|uniref:competence protein CoiA n=1 Tax=Streptomyces sp. ZL-24 TaxID=1933029 RepID=UPI000CD4756A|nr:competence protein CoiA family protein [Streptomyces sp. ZL-24]POG44910.1 competence protein CoiA [Streptomyces sp. ZL-24]